MSAAVKSIEVNLDEYAALCSAFLKCRDKLLEIAKECASCDGTGCITVEDEMVTAFGRVLPCPQCEDIRECLG